MVDVSIACCTGGHDGVRVQAGAAGAQVRPGAGHDPRQRAVRAVHHRLPAGQGLPGGRAALCAGRAHALRAGRGVRQHRGRAAVRAGAPARARSSYARECCQWLVHSAQYQLIFRWLSSAAVLGLLQVLQGRSSSPCADQADETVRCAGMCAAVAEARICGTHYGYKVP